MKKAVFVALLVLLMISLSAQDKPKMEEPKNTMSKMMQDSTHHDHSKMMEDHKMAADKKAFNKFCPVKGGEIDHEVATVEYNGKNYGFCCPGCDQKFKDNPEKYSKNLTEDGQEFLKKEKKSKSEKS